MATHNLNYKVNAHRTYKIYDDIIIDDLETVRYRLMPNRTLPDSTLEDVTAFIKSNTEIFYFTINLLPCDRDYAILVWAFTGLLDSNNNPLFISFLKDRVRDIFVGHYVGTIEFLAESQSRYTSTPTLLNQNVSAFKQSFLRHLEDLKLTYKFSNIDAPKQLISDVYIPNSSASSVSDVLDSQVRPMMQNTEDIDEYLPSSSDAFFDIVHTISDMLLINNWADENGSIYNGLARFLNHISTRIKGLISSCEETEYCILNGNKDAIVNSGLIDKFRGDIKLLYRLEPTGNYELSKVIESKQDYLNAGFTKEQSNTYLKSMSFIDEEVFDATLDDIDINPRNLHHIIGERRSRFPESYINLSEAEITTRITNAIELGIRMNEKDNLYVKPIYYPKFDTVSWLMPFYAEDSFGTEPEMVLVLRKNIDFYEVRTILAYDNVIKNRLVNLSLYGRLW